LLLRPLDSRQTLGRGIALDAANAQIGLAGELVGQPDALDLVLRIVGDELAPGHANESFKVFMPANVSFKGTIGQHA
jgi:hypothetical protein